MLHSIARGNATEKQKEGSEMTRKEAIEILRPDYLSVKYTGGVYGCPCGSVLSHGTHFHFDDVVSSYCCGNCTQCWDEKLSIEESSSLLSVVGEDVIRDYLRKKRV